MPAFPVKPGPRSPQAIAPEPQPARAAPQAPGAAAFGMAGLQPISEPTSADLSRSEAKVREEKAQAATRQSLQNVAVPQAPDPLALAVPESLVSQVAQEMGLLPAPAYRSVSITTPEGVDLVFEVRSPSWEDMTWSMAQWTSVRQRLPELATEYAVREAVTALTACRCVVKLNGHFLWDRLGLTSSIQATAPTWNGQTHKGIPSDTKALMAWALFDDLREEFMGVLSALSDEVMKKPETKEEKAAREAEERKKGAPPPEEENPTPAG